MGCCQDRPSITIKTLNLRHPIKDTTIVHTQRAQILEPIRISIIGDVDKIEFVDELPQQIPSITQIDTKLPNKLMNSGELKETKEIKMTQISDTIIIDMRSGSLLQSPLKQMSERNSSKNLNKKFIEML